MGVNSSTHLEGVAGGQTLIATLTVNPAVDVAAQADEVRPGHKIRTFGERFDPGGGGINVARVVHALGGRARALVVTGGVTGRYVEEMLSDGGVPWSAVPIAGATRISFTVRDRANNAEYRFVPQGPQLEAADCARILEAIEQLDAGWLVVSGSLSPGAPTDFYATVARSAARRGIKVALDTSGAALKASLGEHISVLKPSLSEFESIVGQRARDAPTRSALAAELVRSGVASMIALTLGGEGAILATQQGVRHATALPVRERSGVGAGDSFLAGLVLGLARRESPDRALQLAMATAAVAVSHSGTAQVRRSEVEELLAGARLDAALHEDPTS
jgi:6-phosphofructokinase 2